MAGEITVLNSKADFDALVKAAGDKAVIVDFHATWCGPCKMISPSFVEYAGTYPNIIAAKADVDEADDLAQDCKVEAMPTFMVFKNGTKVDALTGASKDKLKELFSKYN